MFAELHVERGRLRAVLPCLHGTIIRNETDTFKYPGCHVFPGFVDTHAHIAGLGEKLSLISLHGSESMEECLANLLAGKPQSNGWIRAMGWNQERWNPNHWPTKDSIDQHFPETPVVASRIDGHAFWVNSVALQRAGIDPHGHSGILIDDQMNAIWEALPAHSNVDLRQMIVAATNMCSQMGITEVHDMDVSGQVLSMFRELAEEGLLPVRVQSFVRAQHNEWQSWGLLPAIGEFHRSAGVKMFADGALGSRGALLRDPYVDDSSTSGISTLSVEQMIDRCRNAIDAGWACIATHAIGDEAVRRVLDVYEHVRSWSDSKDTILRIEHAQHVHPEDLTRIASLNITACVQPIHCMSDASMAELRLGAERCGWSYRWKSLLNLGIPFGAGSDFPIESPDVLAGIEAFVRRVPPGMQQSWQPQERISRAQAINAYTAGGHATSGMEYRRGHIRLGFDADLVVLERDIESCSEIDISSTRVVATFAAGRPRYMI